MKIKRDIFFFYLGNFAAVQNNPAGMQIHPQIRGQMPSGASAQMQISPQDQVIMQGQSNNSNQVSMLTRSTIVFHF